MMPKINPVDTSLRKGPTMADYREDLRRFGPPPRFTVAERLAVLATGSGARVEADAEDGTGTLVKVTILEVDWDSARLFSAASVLRVTLVKESSNEDVRWYRIVRAS